MAHAGKGGQVHLKAMSGLGRGKDLIGTIGGPFLSFV